MTLETHTTDEGVQVVVKTAHADAEFYLSPADAIILAERLKRAADALGQPNPPAVASATVASDDSIASLNRICEAYARLTSLDLESAAKTPSRAQLAYVARELASTIPALRLDLGVRASAISRAANIERKLAKVLRDTTGGAQ